MGLCWAANPGTKEKLRHPQSGQLKALLMSKVTPEHLWTKAETATSMGQVEPPALSNTLYFGDCRGQRSVKGRILEAGDHIRPLRI